MKSPILFTIAVLLVISCNSPQSESSESETNNAETDFDITEARRAINQKTLLFLEAHIQKDTAVLNNIITKDAISYPPKMFPVTGRKAIARLNWQWVNYGIYNFDEKSSRTYGNEDLIVDEGTYQMVYGPDSTKESGNYTNIWKNEGGEWKLYSNIWNVTNQY